MLNMPDAALLARTRPHRVVPALSQVPGEGVPEMPRGMSLAHPDLASGHGGNQSKELQ
jgi:hypothetical protein